MIGPCFATRRLYSCVASALLLNDANCATNAPVPTAGAAIGGCAKFVAFGTEGAGVIGAATTGAAATSAPHLGTVSPTYSIWCIFDTFISISESLSHVLFCVIIFSLLH